MSNFRCSTRMLLLIGFIILFTCAPLKAEISDNFYAEAWSEWIGPLKITVLSGDMVIHDIRHIFDNDPYTPGYGTLFAYQIDIGNDDPNNPEIKVEDIKDQPTIELDDIFKGEARFDWWWEEEWDDINSRWIFEIDNPHMASAIASAVDTNNNNVLWATSTAEVEFFVSGQGEIKIELPYAAIRKLKRRQKRAS